MATVHPRLGAVLSLTGAIRKRHRHNRSTGQRLTEWEAHQKAKHHLRDVMVDSLLAMAVHRSTIDELGAKRLLAAAQRVAWGAEPPDRTELRRLAGIPL